MRAVYLTFLFLCLVNTGNANASDGEFFVDEIQFLSASPELALLDFEGIAAAGEGIVTFAQPLHCGVEFLRGFPKSVYISDSEFVYFFHGAAASDHLIAAILDIDFSNPVEAVGFNLSIPSSAFGSSSGGYALMEVFDASGMLIGSKDVFGESLSKFTTFAGFVSAGPKIASIRITPIFIPNVFASVAIDNFRFSLATPFIVGDVNCDGELNLLDITPFVELISNGNFQAEGDINKDGVVNILDIQPFTELLTDR